MSLITQTNRTMLFEVFNTEKLSLVDLIGKVEQIESLTDEKMQEIDQYLVVRSFKEFLTKFEPVIYGYYDTTTQQLHYQLSKPVQVANALIRTIKLDEENELVRMLLELIRSKQQKRHAVNVLPLEDLLSAFLPEKNVEKLCAWRHQIRQLYYEATTSENKAAYFIEIKKILDEFSKYYGDIGALLPLMIEDIKVSLMAGHTQNTTFTSPLLNGILNMSQENELSILEIPSQGQQLKALSQEQNEDLKELIAEELDKLHYMQDSHLKALILTFFCPLQGNKEAFVDIEDEVLKYNAYMQMYKASCEAFAKVAKPMLENILGVYFFFDQYQIQKGSMPPALLITNIPSKQLIQPEYLKRLEVYLNTTNAKNDFTHTVWMSIIPSIPFEQKEKYHVTRIRFKGNTPSETEEVGDVEILEVIMGLMYIYKIQTYFSFSIGEKTSFQEMKRSGNDLVITQSQPFLKKHYSEFLIPCYPNFTLIPRENSCIKVGEKMMVTDENKPIILKNDVFKFWLDGVYIKAAYVAAGFVAAYQCPKYLESIYGTKKIGPYPGIRYDIEKNQHAFQHTTSLPKENPGLPLEIKAALIKKPFGFLFSSDNVYHQGELIDKITVFNARSLYFDGKQFEPVYKTYVSNYIERTLRYETIDFKKDRIPQFFSSHPMSPKSQWLAYKETINAILGEKDDISFAIDEQEAICEVNITLNDEVKALVIAVREEES